MNFQATDDNLEPPYCFQFSTSFNSIALTWALYFLSSKLGTEITERLSAIGHGETQLINDCGNGVICNEGLHQQNRRTTLKINKQIKKAVNLTLEERMELRRAKNEVVAGLD